MFCDRCSGAAATGARSVFRKDAGGLHQECRIIVQQDWVVFNLPEGLGIVKFSSCFVVCMVKEWQKNLASLALDLKIISQLLEMVSGFSRIKNKGENLVGHPNNESF